MDSRDRAERQKEEWAIDGLPIGCGLDEDTARDWGLFISNRKKAAEPDRFAEPGAAVIDPGGRLYAIYLQSVPFRPTVAGRPP